LESKPKQDNNPKSAFHPSPKIQQNDLYNNGNNNNNSNKPKKLKTDGSSTPNSSSKNPNGAFKHSASAAAQLNSMMEPKLAHSPNFSPSNPNQRPAPGLNNPFQQQQQQNQAQAQNPPGLDPNFMLAQQQAAALLFRNPNLLNEPNNPQIKQLKMLEQQYQNMLNSNMQNQSKFMHNEMPPFSPHMPPHLQPQQQQMQQHPNPSMFMSPQHAAMAQNEEMRRLEMMERERQIRMFTHVAAMSGAGVPGMHGMPGMPGAINEELFRLHLQQQQQKR